MATAFAILVTFVIIGWLWVYIARPILEDYGVLAPRETVNTSDDAPADIMSRSDDPAPASALSSLETDRQTDRQTPQTVAPRAEQLLTLYKLMRAAGIGREDARAAFKEAGLPLNNDVWRDAAPPPKTPAPSDDDDVLITPYAGRRTRASYYPDDPDLEFQPPR